MSSGRDDGIGVGTGGQWTSPDLLRVVVDSALAAVVTMDEQGLITGWGARAQQTFGWSPGEAIGRSMAEVIVPLRYRAAHTAGLERYRETGEGPVLGKVLEMSAIDRSGREFPAEIAISLATAVDDRVTFIAFIRDITERQEARDRQEALLRAAQEAQRSIRDFANMTVHELRAPLAVASGYVSMLLDGSLGKPGDHWLQPMEAVSSKLRELGRRVDELLATAQAEAGRLDPQLTSLDLRAEAAAAVERARPRAELAGASIDLRQGDQGSPSAADRAMLGTILDNLINNAIAYAGPAPRVVVEVASDRPEISVSDEGPGVPRGMREAIFERFVRVTGVDMPRGSGLGLYLSRRLAEAQGGRLELLDTDRERGSTFRLTLPGV